MKFEEEDFPFFRLSHAPQIYSDVIFEKSGAKKAAAPIARSMSFLP